jgi:hypothetical protein
LPWRCQWHAFLITRARVLHKKIKKVVSTAALSAFLHNGFKESDKMTPCPTLCATQNNNTLAAESAFGFVVTLFA